MPRSKSQRLPVRVFNQANRLLRHLGRTPERFDADALMDAASGATGLDDFGRPGFERGLRVLVETYESEANLNPFGRWMVRQELLGILSSRLAVVDAWKRDPRVLEAEIERPIFVLGLPRTGTTALHDLLARDPNTQALDYWLAAAPGPRPPPDQVKGDPRYKRAAQGLRLTYYLDPGLRAIHNLTPDGPDECRHLLQESFTDDTFDSNATIPSYTGWYAQTDMRPSYEHHRDVLKLIQSTCGERHWALKYPAHMTHLHVLLEIYPDACIVQTHRDPARVLPSLCSLVSGWRGIYEDEIDPEAIGRWQLDMWVERMEHALAVREKANPAQFFDIHFREMIEDPVAVVKRMNQHFGFPFDEPAERRLRAWHAEHPQGKLGGHRYRAEDFGLSYGEMGERFKAYRDHFDVPTEAAV